MRAAAYVGLGAWFVASCIGQHPQRAFDRVRQLDPTGTLIPDWRFFAPEPAQHDFVLLRRTLDADGTETPWESIVEIKPRTWRHAFWFPERRLDKAVHDLCDQITRQMSILGDDGTNGPSYALLRGLAERHVREASVGRYSPQGFQFMIARCGGYDETEEPDYIYLSRFEPL
jgi:hypothetical protein